MAAAAARWSRGWVAPARRREAPCAPGAPTAAPLGGWGPPPRAGIGPNRWPREPARPLPCLALRSPPRRGRWERGTARSCPGRRSRPCSPPASGAEERRGEGLRRGGGSAGSPGAALPVWRREGSVGAAGVGRAGGDRPLARCEGDRSHPAAEPRRKAAWPGAGGGSAPLLPDPEPDRGNSAAVRRFTCPSAACSPRGTPTFPSRAF